MSLFQVNVLNISDMDLSEYDILVMGTDGLWDVTSNEKAAEITNSLFTQFMDEKHKYISGAQALVANARGKPYGESSWRTSEGKPATGDDVSVFVIPILPHKVSYQEFDKKISESVQKLLMKSSENNAVDNDNVIKPFDSVD